MPLYVATPDKIADRDWDRSLALSPASRDRRAISSSKLVLGWREWMSLPELEVPAIKAKIDTGARTSSLHAYFVEPFRERGARMVRFGIHPLQRNRRRVIECLAAVSDTRMVTDSGGHREERFFIATKIAVAGVEWDIEISLTNRDTMRFRMLLGREAMRGAFLVDPQVSYLTGRALAKSYS